MGQSLPRCSQHQKRGSRFHLVSWEPLDPIGFTPCGIAFGALRKCYTAACNFHADEVAGTNRIRWYRVGPGTPIYPHLTVFTPQVDFDTDAVGGPFERQGPGRFVRTFHAGFNYSNFPAIEVDGDKQDFLGRSPLSKHFEDGELIAPLECVGVERFLATIELDADLGEIGELAAVELDADQFWAPFPGQWPASVSKIVKGREYLVKTNTYTRGWFYMPIKAGQKYLVQLTGPFFPGQLGTLWNGSDIFDVDSFEAILPSWTDGTSHEWDYTATQNGLIILRVTNAFETIVSGYTFSMSTYVENIVDGLAELDAIEADPVGLLNAAAALELAAEEADADTSPAPAALELEATEETVEPDITPGSTCDEAPTLAEDVEYLFTIPAGAQHWFKVPNDTEASHHVSIWPTGAGLTEVDFYKGEDCATKTLLFGGSWGGGCVSWTDDASGWRWFFIFGSGFGDREYTIQWGSGGCP